MQNPRARRQGLLIEELPTELLVYDQKNNRAHCLNASAALVFKHADGTLSVSDIARRTGESLNAPFTDDLAWLALQELDKNELLETALPLVPPQGRSRRDVIVAAGAAALLPLVLAITAPTPASAQSGASTAAPPF